ncbi:hypothetical protein M501DRAFT_1015475 [Patellaria atrata CBS 101060]|uniref:Uncharacterized protein n=1 Tax=Patellaria atrata CBS 101060 TaxID=1346257 RepID=A0A9P4VSG3_9PEZI|nr:hypothetical protein M501DRAFT_1015475 [Patellaria atrata CBS 101060]
MALPDWAIKARELYLEKPRSLLDIVRELEFLYRDPGALIPGDWANGISERDRIKRVREFLQDAGLFRVPHFIIVNGEEQVEEEMGEESEEE